jgi:hypothetical protein
MSLSFPGSFPLLLAADWVDLLKALAPIFFILYWAVTNWAGRKGQPQQRRPVRPAAAPPRPAPQAAPIEVSLRDQVEEFKRRSAEQRTGQKMPLPAAPVVRPAEEPAQPRKRRRPLAERPIATASQASPSTEPRKVGQLAEALAQRAEERAATADARLTSIERGDAERERHLHQTFDHQLGRLKDAAIPDETTEANAPAPQPATPAAALAKMLRDPGGVRQAILLGEILNRPEGRWR